MRTYLLALVLICWAADSRADLAVVSRPLVDGYVIDIPTKIFEFRSDEYLRERDAPRNQAGDTGKYLVMAESWSGGSRFAYISVRIHHAWDKLYEHHEYATIQSWREFQRKMIADVKPSLDRIGARVIEELEPRLSVNASKDKMVLLRYRRQDRNTITLVGLLMMIRPKNSFAVTYSYDEQVAGDAVNRALSSIRRER